MSDKIKVAVTPDAWAELYRILYALTGDLALWSEAHNLPVQISMGALAGVYDVVAETSNACDCEECHHVEDTFADELATRLLATSVAVH